MAQMVSVRLRISLGWVSCCKVPVLDCRGLSHFPVSIPTSQEGGRNKRMMLPYCSTLRTVTISSVSAIKTRGQATGWGPTEIPRQIVRKMKPWLWRRSRSTSASVKKLQIFNQRTITFLVTHRPHDSTPHHEGLASSAAEGPRSSFHSSSES